MTDSPDTPQTPAGRILVIDDDPGMLEFITLMLQDEHRVTSAANPGAGMSAFRAATFDIVLTDREMPGMTGDELADLVHAESPGMPIVLITGQSGAQVDTTKFAGFLPKPFTRLELLAMVNDLLPAKG